MSRPEPLSPEAFVCGGHTRILARVWDFVSVLFICLFFNSRERNSSCFNKFSQVAFLGG